MQSECESYLDTRYIINFCVKLGGNSGKIYELLKITEPGKEVSVGDYASNGRREVCQVKGHDYTKVALQNSQISGRGAIFIYSDDC